MNTCTYTVVYPFRDNITHSLPSFSLKSTDWWHIGNTLDKSDLGILFDWKCQPSYVQFNFEKGVEMY